LSLLVRQQPIPGVEVLALGEHVDYWDRLGWRDPFSSAAFSARQAEYEARIVLAASSYTPQLIIDGHLERIGSDIDAVHQAMQQAAQGPKATVGVAVVHPPNSNLRVELHVEVPADLAIRDWTEILIAVTEDNLTTDVRRGENGGRTLKHGAVARSLKTVGALTAKDRTFSMTTSVPWASEWKSANVRVIVFLQERGSRRIVGAGSTTIPS
jgi:hypothetical protein